jgi:hypothetical protein
MCRKDERAKKSQALGMTKERVTSSWKAVSDEKRLGPATTLDETVALSLVIPGGADLSRPAVEGSAVLRTFLGNAAERSAVSFWASWRLLNSLFDAR